MHTVEDIVAVAERLPSAEFLRLRRKLDRLEQRQWKAECARAGRELEAAGVTDKDIDQIVMRRRREGRR